ncbi:hypothetical protein [uncultured Draconibacterium sp.]|uniref:hypothetical protein n=1 Tax=uncultured Draconibacterium sp. TaxID=1573823 RepID=UPI0025F36D75|nr:hypothetical protein [uncultured Draconibacterium sp.]
MKTKNNVQKTTTRLVALALILVELSLNVQAQNLGKSLSGTVSFNEIAFAMVDNSGEFNSSSTKADVYLANFDVDTEDALTVEDWMTDMANFDVYSQYSQLEQEEAMKVEDWMIDDKTFAHWSFQFKVETESPLVAEDWMTSGEVWNR